MAEAVHMLVDSSIVSLENLGDDKEVCTCERALTKPELQLSLLASPEMEKQAKCSTG